MFLLRSGVAIGPASGFLRPRIAEQDAALRLIVHGDSITLDKADSNYTVALTGLLNAAGTVTRLVRVGIYGISYNYAWPSSGYSRTLTEDAPIQIDPFRLTTISTALVVFAGTNGFWAGFHSAATESADFDTYLTARLAIFDPARIYVCTMLPTTSSAAQLRTDFNAHLVTKCAAVGVNIVRLDLNASIGVAGQESDTNWFYDGLHPTVAGHAVIAQEIFAVMHP